MNYFQLIAVFLTFISLLSKTFHQNILIRGDQMTLRQIVLMTLSLLVSTSVFAHIDVEKVREIREDKKVVHVRNNQYLYTLTPLNILWQGDLKQEAYEQAQNFAAMITKQWHVGIANAVKKGSSGYSPSELDKLNYKELNEKIKNGEIKLTAYDIIRKAQEADDPTKAIKELLKSQEDIDKLTTSYNELISSLYESDEVSKEHKSTIDSLKSYIVTDTPPDAFIFYIGGKFPESISRAVANSRLKALTGLTLGGLNLTMTVRPWRIVEHNLNTGEERVDWYAERGAQVWYLKDKSLGGLQKVDANFRAGAGVLWGDFDKVEDLSGGFVGVSKNFDQCFGVGSNNKLINCNVKAGVIGPGLVNLIENKINTKAAYFMTGWQFGISEVGSKKFAPHVNAGYVTQFYDLKSFIEETDPKKLTKEALERTVPEEQDGEQSEADRVLRPHVIYTEE